MRSKVTSLEERFIEAQKLSMERKEKILESGMEQIHEGVRKSTKFFQCTAEYITEVKKEFLCQILWTVSRN